MPVDDDRPPAIPGSDRYRAHRFRVVWEGRYVAGFARMSAPGRQRGPRPMPGQRDHAPVVLEQGITVDRAFETWASSTRDYLNARADAQGSINDLPKTVVVETYNEAGQKIVAYRLYGCMPAAWVTLPDLSKPDGDTAIMSLTLVYHDRDRNPPAAGADALTRTAGGNPD